MPLVQCKRPGGARSRTGCLSALTLVEMLVIFAICVVLALLLVPVMLRTRENARAAVCANNLNALGQAYGTCLIEQGNYLPAAYFAIEESQGSYEITLNDPGGEQVDPLFGNGGAEGLVCPSDRCPVKVQARNSAGAPMAVRSSYAYNVALPTYFKNANRVPQPVSTVTFYDGDLTSVVGPWEHSRGWAESSVCARHRGKANYLFMDGHVEATSTFPAEAFDGGDALALLEGDTSGTGWGSQWDGTSDDGAAPEDRSLRGSININPNNNKDWQFSMVLPDGFQVTRDDLHGDRAMGYAGFHPDHMEYLGPAASVLVKPKGNGNQNSLLVSGQIYPLLNRNRYLITGTMNVHLYNDKRKHGRAMGRWWIDINADEATIQILEH